MGNDLNNLTCHVTPNRSQSSGQYVQPGLVTEKRTWLSAGLHHDRSTKRWPSPELQSETHAVNRRWWPHHSWEIRCWTRDRICHQKKERWEAGETEITASTTETLLYLILLLLPRLLLSFTWRKQWLSEVKQLFQFHITEEEPEPTQTWALDFISRVLNHFTLLPATQSLTGHSLTVSNGTGLRTRYFWSTGWKMWEHEPVQMGSPGARAPWQTCGDRGGGQPSDKPNHTLHTSPFCQDGSAVLLHLGEQMWFK